MWSPIPLSTPLPPCQKRVCLGLWGYFFLPQGGERYTHVHVRETCLSLILSSHSKQTEHRNTRSGYSRDKCNVLPRTQMDVRNKKSNYFFETTKTCGVLFLKKFSVIKLHFPSRSTVRSVHLHFTFRPRRPGFVRGGVSVRGGCITGG